MTVHKSFKRLVRARMAKTSESYTTARSRLLASGEDHAAADDTPQLACSDERIRERTGLGWEDWFDLLDSWGADAMTHTQLAKRVAEHLGTAALNWNAQAVSTSFERARGKRAVGERVGGVGFAASASKTIAVGAEEVFVAFVDPSRRAGWLPDLELSERAVSKPKTARFDVAGGATRLLVAIDAKSPDKCTVTVEESRLAGPEARERSKSFWRRALTTLKAQLEDR
jgi:hypothetical protein